MSDIRVALAIDGWMSESELKWLAEQAALHQCIVEIGCYKGRSTRALADNTRGTVITIDDFKGPREVGLTDRDGIYAEYMRNTASCSNLTTFVRDHKAVNPAAIAPDMVFIDGSHTYEDVLWDIKHWLAVLTPDGLICGHDYMTNWPGVDRAVRECFTQIGRVAESIWIGESR